MENNEKKKWEKPDFKSLDLKETNSGYTVGNVEDTYFIFNS